ncbi:hypothetical protein QCA50_005125 [Cerrena zonata]|uniref:Uncharacterized protein n=1 Tax=Cerrena zonata TaxID=2478898 RepID=A0AAW0GEL9_9APHY
MAKPQIMFWGSHRNLCSAIVVSELSYYPGDIEYAVDESEEMFRDIAEIIHSPAGLSRADFFDACKPGGKYDGIQAIYRRDHTTLGLCDRDLIEGLPTSVKWIAQMSAGYDQIDISACKKKGVYVSNTPGAVDEATATTALYLMISALRRFPQAERHARDGQWRVGHDVNTSHDLSGCTIGILGLGGIGMKLAEYAHVFPMRVLYHSRRKVEDAPEWCEYFEKERLEEMLGMADVLSIHIPLTKGNENYVDEKMIRALKKGAIIVNTARGGVMDDEALIGALTDGHLNGAGLDVFPEEPRINPRLIELPNVAILPHIGTGTYDTLKKMEIVALENIRDFLLTGIGKTVVPEMRDWSPSQRDSYGVDIPTR